MTERWRWVDNHHDRPALRSRKSKDRTQMSDEQRWVMMALTKMLLCHFLFGFITTFFCFFQPFSSKLKMPDVRGGVGGRRLVGSSVIKTGTSQHLMQWRNHTASLITACFSQFVLLRKSYLLPFQEWLIDTPTFSAVPRRSLGPGSPSAGPLLALYATSPSARCIPSCSSPTRGYQPRPASALARWSAGSHAGKENLHLSVKSHI